MIPSYPSGRDRATTPSYSSPGVERFTDRAESHRPHSEGEGGIASRRQWRRELELGTRQDELSNPSLRAPESRIARRQNENLTEDDGLDA